MFKVVPDQLRISDGWVRCGQCDEVFDANAHLQPAFETAPEVVQKETPAELDWGAMLDTETRTPKHAMALEFPKTVQAESPAVDAVDFDPIPSAFSDRHTPNVPGDAASKEADFDVIVDPLDAVSTDDTVVYAGSSIVADQEPPRDQVPEPAFALQEPKTPQFLKRDRLQRAKGARGVRVVWMFLSVLMACVLVMQVLVQERDRIVATTPSMSTWMQPLCNAMDCKIAPLKQIESIVIDQSSFSKAKSEGYLLGFSVKSTALTEVATPSLELTLTDMQDRAVVRRVFSPRELGYQSLVLNPGGEWSGSVPVDVKLADGSERISGYRLLAFYP